MNKEDHKFMLILEIFCIVIISGFFILIYFLDSKEVADFYISILTIAIYVHILFGFERYFIKEEIESKDTEGGE